MQKQRWYHIVPKNTGLSIYAWVAFCILPFYFVFKTASVPGIIFGLTMIMLFFTAYRLSFVSTGWPVYTSVAIEMFINILMTVILGYVYFALLLAFYIGNLPKKSAFISLYVIHLTTTLAAASLGFFTQTDVFLSQLPFIVISLIGVIFLPVNLYSRAKREELENELRSAKEKLSDLVVLEERHRIARDLHDTLGQKLSLIRLKSELADKTIHSNPERAQEELTDINETARIALKEVREMVSDMRNVRLHEEILRVQAMLKAAEITWEIQGETELRHTPMLAENVLTMCLKEAVTNVVKHSEASHCQIAIYQTIDEVKLLITDDGKSFKYEDASIKHNGLRGMRERLEFVNGTLDITTEKGTTLSIRIPNVVKHIT
ncbi:Histidine kinase [Lentibacillus sp. JNUCC-1]|uniref:sensor histidine kinase n=1 Tax=Lentibacillus sp. JNUCC-1 TaxID=2654513 RepID=UPI0012E8C5DF|nr:sensor histidine kinase [Lentibacillus sp. JNUCC-1]MUV36352.1 Histidine kinase [Lentibacillus sp. JNUCC-1]